jgi:hypothetical protein
LLVDGTALALSLPSAPAFWVGVAVLGGNKHSLCGSRLAIDAYAGLLADDGVVVVALMG